MILYIENMFMSPYKSATFDNGIASGGGSGSVAVDANDDLLGLRNLSATQNITSGSLNTGKIKATGDVVSSEGLDISCVFGNSKIGWTGSQSNYVGFGHKDQFGLTKTAFQQFPSGKAIINAPTGEDVWLCNAGIVNVALAANGKLGVNNLIPQKELDVIGEIKATGNLSVANIETTTGLITGPSTMSLDPAVVGNNTGTVIIKGDLQVEGTTTTLNSSTVSITDKKVQLAADATTQAETFGAGLEVFGNKTFTYENGDKWVSNVKLEAPTLSATSNLLIGSSSLTSGLIDTLGATAGTVVASKAVVVDGNKDITGFNNITSDGAIVAAENTNTTHKFGYASIGLGFNNAAGFGHSAIVGDVDGYALLQTSVGATFLHAHAGQHLSFRIGSSGFNSMTCLDNGTVQIGPITAATAGAMLDVKGRVYADRISCSLGQDISSEFGYAVIGHMPQKVGSTLNCDGDAVFAHKDYANCLDYCIKQRPDGRTIVNAANGRPIQFRCANATFLTIKSNGCLGINLPDPSTRLAIDGDVSCSGPFYAGQDLDTIHHMGKLKLGKVAFNGWAGIANQDRSNTTDYALIQSPDGITILNAADTKQIEFKIADTLKMKLASNGFFGIGRSNPSAKLDVNGNIIGSTQIQVGVGSTGQNIFGTTACGDLLSNGSMVITHNTLKNNAGDFCLHQTADGATKLNCKTGKTIDFAINGASKLHIDTNGKVGVGLTNPTEELDVAGDIKASGTITASDDRLKHNETAITNGLSVIRRLAPVAYDKTKDMILPNFNGDLGVPFKREAGFIAQDVKLIGDVAFAVRGGDYTNEQGQTITSSFGINYNDLFTYGLAATKEIDAIISAYPNRFDALEGETEANILKGLSNQYLIDGLRTDMTTVENTLITNAATAAANLLTLEINTGTDRVADNAAANLLNTRVGSVESEVSTLQNIVSADRGRINVLETQRAADVITQFNDNKARREQSELIETSVGALTTLTLGKAAQADLDAAEARITTLEAVIQTQLAQITTLETDLNAVEADRAAQLILDSGYRQTQADISSRNAQLIQRLADFVSVPITFYAP